MTLKTVYLLLCVLGIALPYSQFIPWLAENGLNLPLFVEQLMTNRVSRFFGMDVIVSAVVLVVFMLAEMNRTSMRKAGWVLLALLTVGVSLALPLLLYMRESHRERSVARSAAA